MKAPSGAPRRPGGSRTSPGSGPRRPGSPGRADRGGYYFHYAAAPTSATRGASQLHRFGVLVIVVVTAQVRGGGGPNGPAVAVMHITATANPGNTFENSRHAGPKVP